MVKQKNACIAVMLIGIVLLSLGLTALGGVYSSESTEEKISVVASFYPMYTAALRVVGDSNGVAVSCLTQPTTGCVHEHQLSPTERATLETADVLLLNGAGAEDFLTAVLPQLSAAVVDTSAGLDLHEHEEGHTHEGHTHTVNDHIWMNPTYYAKQVACIRDALCEADAEHAATYRENAAGYLREIEAVAEDLATAAAAIPFKKALLFHESMQYLAETMQLEIVGTLPIGEDDGFSAAEVAAVADRLAGQSVLFLYDNQYPTQLTQLATYAESSAVAELNSAVMPMEGVADGDVWLCAMKQNLHAIQEVAA